MHNQIRRLLRGVKTTMRFISSKAEIHGEIEGDAVILGNSIIGSKTLIGEGCIIGYPIRKTLKTIIADSTLKKIDLKAYDERSSGSQIGDNVIIRSGTIVYERANIGDDVETGHHVLIRENSKIGSHTRIGTNTVIDGSIEVGQNVNIQSGVYLPPGTIVGDDVFLGPYTVVTNDLYPPSPKITGVTIKKAATIGAGSILVAGITVGERAVVASGSIVTKDVPPNTVAKGCPARSYLTRADYDIKQKKHLTQK
jgi:acetyltransferase-like isoleucine patch superfamily enzyme